MAYTPDLSQIFRDGQTLRLNTEDRAYSECQLQVQKIAELTLTTGHIVACDPLTTWGAMPFNRAVGLSRYPVLLTTAHYIGGDKRAAYASVQFRSEAPVRWDMAVNAYQDTHRLIEKDFFGYGVNSGRGCFMDAQALPIMKARARERRSDLSQIFDATGFDTGSLVLDQETGLNVVNFHSGAGNGIYPSFFGFDSNHHIVCLTTDFCLFPDEENNEAYA